MDDRTAQTRSELEFRLSLLRLVAADAEAEGQALRDLLALPGAREAAGERAA
jgi:hypothetical protein